MARLTKAALAVSMSVTVYAQSSSQIAGSVVSIYFPGADQLPYVASLIGESNNAKTLAISCAPGVNSDTCGFPSSVTVTAGPSTAYVSVANSEATFIYDCKITGSTAAICVETFNGDVAYIATSSGKSVPTGSTSSVLTETLDSTDITWMPITITAPAGAATKTGATATATATGTGTSSGTVQSSTSTQSAGDDADDDGSDSDTSDNSDNAWAELSSLGTSGGSASTSVSSDSATISATGSQTGTGTTGTTPGLSSTTGTQPALWTGAANRPTVLRSYAAGLLAVAGILL